MSLLPGFDPGPDLVPSEASEEQSTAKWNLSRSEEGRRERKEGRKELLAIAFSKGDSQRAFGDEEIRINLSQKKSELPINKKA